MTKNPSSSALVPGILHHLQESVALRHHIHAHPELAFEEHATSELVAGKLAEWGYEVHRGLGGTGVVGTLKKGSGPRRLGLRADMDALPIHEETKLPYASQHGGTMHACGHDGHTASLLAAARELKDTDFDGTLHLIFQPAEEGLGGARKMVEDGLFERFPCDGVFAFHNMPGYPVGKFGTLPGAFMASSDTVIIKIIGNGGHGSMPHITVDAILVASYLVVALQSVVARNVDPRQMAVVTVGALHAGNAPNVIAETAELRLSVRAYSPEVRALLRQRITELAQTQAQAMGARAEVDYHWRYPALQNDAGMTAFAEGVVRDWLGQDAFIENVQQLTGSEDFSFMLEQCPGCYVIIGNGEGEQGGCMVHNPRYDFNDGILPIAASYWVKLTQRFLSDAPLVA
ncbi:M20 aminoacylase family protein [Herbaspirillum huttiense F1]|uniref:M20 aminoacylase family protein n=1 Tax=Herbaspirillum TaxID=963 RepID=UPI000EAC5A6D|nr:MULTISPECIES: M20 aminoacylase family protein [Herbaspirillum]MBP1316392.1 hippurate hydrolase [Herbaspirillum sp. 1130]MDR6739733.1 hippurate hydrolase [Herbaspirillum sp. 1173]MDT0354334.1 M20 aminoacylase family protein [Herbaspirillum huttiense F1]